MIYAENALADAIKEVSAKKHLTMTPSYAVQIWTKGDDLWIQFEGHSVNIPITEPRRLLTVLQARERAALKNEKITIALDGAPCQLQIYDAFKEALNKESNDKSRRAEESRWEKEAAKRQRRGEREMKMKDANDILASAGL